jgi:hypothetical protein
MNITNVYCIGVRWEDTTKDFKQRFERIGSSVYYANDKSSLENGIRLHGVNWTSRWYTLPPNGGVEREMTFIKDHDIDLDDWLTTVRFAKRHNGVGIPLVLVIDKENNPSTYPDIGDLESKIFLLGRVGFPFDFIACKVGYGRDFSKKPVIKHYELKSEIHSERDIIKKCIEFPPEYYSAGLGILNYFGSYLRQQYPNENATIKIEQEGLTVRLIVSTTDGQLEVIEQALEEFGRIVTGAEKPEHIIQNTLQVLEMKNELRIMEMRVQQQSEFIAFQNASVAQLNKHLGIALSRSNYIDVTVSPTITSSNNITVTFNISQALQDIANLKADLPPNTDAGKELQEVEKAVEAIKNETDPKVVKHSSAMQKLGDFVKKFGENTDNVDKALSTGKKVWETFKELAGTYNSIAQWCGAPQIPKIFTK